MEGEVAFHTEVKNSRWIYLINFINDTPEGLVYFYGDYSKGSFSINGIFKNGKLQLNTVKVTSNGPNFFIQEEKKFVEDNLLKSIKD